MAELAGRLKARERRLESEEEMTDRREASEDEMSMVSDEAMSVDGVKEKSEFGNDSSKVKNLLRAILNGL